MKINVQAVHFDADPGLVSFIQSKLSKLDTFYDRVVSGEVFLKLDKGEKSKVHKKLIEVKLIVPGQTIYVEEKGDTFEEATDIVVETLKSKIKKFKDKKNIVEHKKPELAVVEEEVTEDEF
ncbi:MULTISPECIES: HPF/RaiA family ribosome-associated protein [unclassified Emticicia]|uniref:HPF/RaiA family ribosome-associated protein n=1 Tax=unclassified Emticicia TaxID=2627301 RepID=UPI000C768D9F|nr:MULTISPECIES: HPF/RaiA family ribosome-associated protein [unclassified Emticicia]PLK43310.1 30S ribosomal protein S30 [Emticicia sp. TH156]UTA68784.1 HPF/RaiA family ribosome-associated protein [Emticicia sp. 21SJ11W-3]